MTHINIDDNPLQQIMNPKSVVVAGASTNFMKMGAIQALNLVHSGYGGEIIFLHPTEKTLMGRPAYAHPDDLPFAPDLALLITPAKVTLELLDGLGRRGVRRAVIITAGFREMGENGARLEEELVAVAARHGIRFVGPNCIGVLNAHKNFNVTVFPYRDEPGGLGLVSQSGTYVAQTMPLLRERGILYSAAVSVGNATNIDETDVLAWFGAHEETRAVAMYIEGIRRGRDFLETAREVVKRKPVVALYVGGTATGSRSCLSHTGSLGGPDALYDGIFEQAGVIRASTAEELFGWGHALATMPPPKGRSIAILTHSGGPATSMADACEKSGLELPVFSPALQERIRPFIEPTASAKNPVDLTFSMEYENFSDKIPEILFASDEVDGLLVHGLMDSGFAEEFWWNVKDLVGIPKEDFLNTIRLDLDRLLAMPGRFGKPMTASTFLWNDHAAKSLLAGGVPLFTTPEAAVKAMAALVRYGEILRRPPLGETSAPPPARDRLAGGIMDEHEAKNLLAAYGVPTAKESKVARFTEAAVAAEEIGWPVVLKGLPPGVAHKTEAGLVHLGIASTDQLVSAWNEIEKVHPGCPRLVARMVRGARELVVGMTRRPEFGPCVMLGIGGIFTEAVRDAVFRAAPLATEEAAAMPDSLRLRRLLDAQRGLPAVDREALAGIIVAVGRLACEHPEIAEIDINPLVVEGGRPVAVDALIVVDGGGNL